MQIDAPVCGGVRGAEKGTVAVMASGPRADVEAVEPALKVIGKFFYIGEQPGAGQTMKLCNNVLSAAAMAATSESMVMGVKAGLDPRIMLDVINASSGRSTATEQKFPEVVIPRKFNQGFTAGLMMKDVNLFVSEAKALGVPIEVIEAVAGPAQAHLRRDRAGQGHHHDRAADRATRRRRSRAPKPERHTRVGADLPSPRRDVESIINQYLRAKRLSVMAITSRAAAGR